MTFTKEQLIASAHSRIEFAEMMLADNPEPLKERTWSIELELARIALAALESRADAEPVSGTQFRAVADLYSIAVPGGRSVTYSTDAAEASDFRAMGWAVQEYVKLERLQDAYTRPQPAPVVPQIIHSQGGTTVYADYYAIGWNACRAAMLQGKAEPVSQPLAFFDGDISSEDAEKIMDRLREMNSRPGCQQQIISEPVSQPYTLRECFDRLFKHAQGLTFGDDWNRGTAAKYHRDSLIKAVDDCRAMLAAAPRQEVKP